MPHATAAGVQRRLCRGACDKARSDSAAKEIVPAAASAGASGQPLSGSSDGYHFSALHTRRGVRYVHPVITIAYILHFSSKLIAPRRCRCQSARRAATMAPQLSAWGGASPFASALASMRNTNNRQEDATPPSTGIKAAVARAMSGPNVGGNVVAAAPAEGGIKMYSREYYMTCALGGVVSCGAPRSGGGSEHALRRLRGACTSGPPLRALQSHFVCLRIHFLQYGCSAQRLG